MALFALLTGLLEGVGVTLLIPLLSTFGTPLETRSNGHAVALLEGFAAGYSRTQRFVLVASVIMALVLLRCLLQAVGSAFAAWISGRLRISVACALVQRLHSVSYSFFLEHEPGRLMNILTNESWKTSESILVIVQQIASAVTVLVFGFLLCLVSWRLSLMVLFGGLLTTMVQKRFERQLRAVGAQTVASSEILSNRILEAVFGARVIRLFHTQSTEQARFETTADQLRAIVERAERLMGVRGPLIEAMRTTLLILVLLAAALNGVSLPVLAAFLALMNRLQPHLTLVEQSSASFAAASAHFSEVEWLLSSANESPKCVGDIPLPHFNEIRFQNVSFQYPNRNGFALQDVSFVLRRGRPTALTGASGCGKSTVINLLTRLLDPTSGVIHADGIRLSDIRLLDWLGACAVAGQDIDLVDGTIAENVSYGSPKMSRDLIEEAIRSAGADFVYDLPKGLETVVGRLGLGLSGGQRQRIGIARALARKPDFLILDEATNAIDQETESFIVSTFRSLPSDMMILVVSHRPATLALCTDSVVLNEGKVVRTTPLASLIESPAC